MPSSDQEAQEKESGLSDNKSTSFRAGPGECMKWAYKQAGEAMLVRSSTSLQAVLLAARLCFYAIIAEVTTVTTAGSFYANCVSILRIVKQFGFFMGSPVAQQLSPQVPA